MTVLARASCKVRYSMVTVIIEPMGSFTLKNKAF